MRDFVRAEKLNPKTKTLVAAKQESTWLIDGAQLRDAGCIDSRDLSCYRELYAAHPHYRGPALLFADI
jgi:hypothetical protein